MIKHSAQSAFQADRDDRIAAAAATMVVLSGGLLSLAVLGSITVNAIV